jgi:threonine dehydratase
MYSYQPTPLIRLGNLFPTRQVFAKCEFIAPSGCFKIRGAVHLLQHLNREPLTTPIVLRTKDKSPLAPQTGLTTPLAPPRGERGGGEGGGRTRRLVVPSMGNTALGAAVGAREFGFTMTGVVPQTIRRDKDEKLRALGVNLIKIAGGGSDLIEHATRIAEEESAYFVHPHLDPCWTDGYQAIAREIFEALPDCRSMVLPVGGGGLLMGLTQYLLSHPRPITLVGCEPYNYPTYAPFDHERSRTIADGLMLEKPHPLVQERIKATKFAIELIPEADIRRSLRDLYTAQALVVEPSSAITTAFVHRHPDRLQEPICVILTGENIARDDFFGLIQESDPMPAKMGGQRIAGK